MGSNSFHGLRGEALWVVAAKLGTGIFQFAISLIMARMLGVAAFGTFEFAQRTLAVVLVASNLGLTWRSLTVSSRSDPEATATLGAELSTILDAALFFSVLTSVGFVWLLYATGGEHFTPGFLELTVLLLMVPALTLLLIISESFRGLAKIREASIFSGLFSNGIALGVFAGFYFLAGQLSVASSLVVLSVAASITASVAYVIFRRTVADIRPRFHWVRMAHHTRESAAFALYNVLVVAAATVDIWAVKALLPIEDVGLYGLASRLSQFFLIPWMISSALFRGRLARAIGRADFELVDQIVALNTRVLGFIMATLVVLIYLAGDALLEALLPPEFAEAKKTMVLLALAFSIQATLSVYSLGLLFSSATLYKFVVPLFQMAVFGALVGPLASRSGIEGVGIAMLIAITASAVLQIWLFMAAFRAQRAGNPSILP